MLLSDYMTASAGVQLADSECPGGVHFMLLPIAQDDAIYGLRLEAISNGTVDFLVTRQATSNCYVSQ